MNVSVTDPGTILFNFDGCMREQGTKWFKKESKEGVDHVEYFFLNLGWGHFFFQNRSISSCLSFLQISEN